MERSAFTTQTLERAVCACPCGRLYVESTWSALPFEGLSQTPSGTLEHRACSCGRRIARETTVPVAGVGAL